MKITRIKAENFKSYKKIDIELNNLNFIIGGNASGKSNYVNLLKFFNDIIYYGIDDAILLQGGIKYLLNSNSRKNSSIKINFEINFQEEKQTTLHLFSMDKKMYLPNNIKYFLTIKPNEKGDGYKINNEKLEIKFEHLQNQDGKHNAIGNFNLKINKDSNKKIKDNFNEKHIKEDNEFINLKYIVKLIEREGLLLNNFFSTIGLFYGCHSKIKIYNFDVNLLKSPSSIVARSELEENGSNLVNIIQQLLKSKVKKEKLNKILSIILPFIDDIKVENNVNKSVFFKVKESYNKKEFPSYMLSDGTVNILAVIVALYFQDNNDIIVLEEPERNIHPKLLSILVSILEDVSKNRQIFVTTHNPFIIKDADLNDVILVSRDSTGVSKISKIIDDDKIRIFLENDLGIEDLFVDGILKWLRNIYIYLSKVQ